MKRRMNHQVQAKQFTKPLSTLHLKTAKWNHCKRIRIINDAHFESKGNYIVANRFKLIYVQIKHDRWPGWLRVHGQHAFHSERRGKNLLSRSDKMRLRTAKRVRTNVNFKIYWSEKWFIFHRLERRIVETLFLFYLLLFTLANCVRWSSDDKKRQQRVSFLKLLQINRYST